MIYQTECQDCGWRSKSSPNLAFVKHEARNHEMSKHSGKSKPKQSTAYSDGARAEAYDSRKRKTGQGY